MTTTEEKMISKEMPGKVKDDASLGGEKTSLEEPVLEHTSKFINEQVQSLDSFTTPKKKKMEEEEEEDGGSGRRRGKNSFLNGFVIPSSRVLTPGPDITIEEEPPDEHNMTTYLLSSLSERARDVERMERDAKILEKSMGMDYGEGVAAEEDDLDPELLQRFSSLKKARKKIVKEVKKLEEINVGVTNDRLLDVTTSSAQNTSDNEGNRSSFLESGNNSFEKSTHLLDMERERIRNVALSFEMFLDTAKENIRMERKLMKQTDEKNEMKDKLNELKEKNYKIQIKYEREVGRILLERNRFLNIQVNVYMMILLLLCFFSCFFLLFY